MFRSLAIVGVRKVVFPRVECAQRVGRWIMQVEIANHHRREIVILKQIRGGDRTEGGRLEREIVGVDNPESSELELKEALWGKYVDRNQIGTGGYGG